MTTIANSIDLSTLEVGTEYYFSITDSPLTDEVTSAKENISSNTSNIFNINININTNIDYKTLFEKGYYLKKILIYPITADRYLKIEDSQVPNIISINGSEIDTTNKIFEGYNKIEDDKLNANKKYEIILPEIFFENNSQDTIKIEINLIGYDTSDTDVTNAEYKFGVVFGNKLESKLDGLYEYNQINEMVKKLMNNRDKLLEQNSKNQTIIRARELIKKKIEFHKYWINILYEIIFYTHLVLVVIVILMLLYKLL